MNDGTHILHIEAPKSTKQAPMSWPFSSEIHNNRNINSNKNPFKHICNKLLKSRKRNRKILQTASRDDCHTQRNQI